MKILPNRQAARIAAAALLAAWSGAAQALPVSSCSVDSAGLSCDLYRSDASGNPSKISNVFAFGIVTGPGYLVWIDPGLPLSIGLTDRAAWSDVLRFIDDGTGFSTTGQLLSRGCNDPLDASSCFPPLPGASTAQFAFASLAASGVSTYAAGGSVFRLHVDADGSPGGGARPIALPTSAALVLAAVVALAAVRRAVHVPSA